MNGALAPNRNDVCSALMASLLSPSPGRGEESDMVSALHGFEHFLAQSGGGVGDPDACRTHGMDLELGGVLTTGDHRARMAHATTRRRGAAGDEADHRLLGLAGLDELGTLHLGVAADLADHDDA